jgi:hypothetical protein
MVMAYSKSKKVTCTTNDMVGTLTYVEKFSIALVNWELNKRDKRSSKINFQLTPRESRKIS